MKYGKLISSLTEKQKLSLLTDGNSLNAPWLEPLGVPRMSVTDYRAVVRRDSMGRVPSMSTLGNVFDPDFVREFMKYIAYEAKSAGATMLIAPDVSVDLAGNKEGLSEDPYLCGAYGAAMLSGIKAAGLNAGISDVNVPESNKDFLDEPLDDCIIRDVLLRPFDIAARGDLDAFVSNTGLSEDEDADMQKMLDMIKRDISADIPMLFGTATADGTVTAINAGVTTCINGSAISLSAALENYRKLNEGVDNGTVTLDELEKAERSGAALSPAALDAAVDRVFDFLINSKQRIKEGEQVKLSQPIKSAYEKSTVLLKNANGALPISRGQKVATIGLIPERDSFLQVFADKCKSRNIQYIGHSDGYDASSELGDNELVYQALSQAQAADVVLVFLDEPEDSTKLSANRIGLLSSLKKSKKKIVGVCVNRDIDLDVDDYCDALLVTEINCPESKEALSSILVGEVSPSGKLAKTVYRDREKYFRDTIRKDKQGGRIGRFCGYRLYDTAGADVGYPFGHGLTYSQVNYSGISLKGYDLSVTLENKGHYPVTEIVQVYIGKKDSSLVVPKKELRAVAAQYLKPGQRVKVLIKLEDFAKSLICYDKSVGKSATETGSYVLYVGRSVTDIRLQTQFSVVGKKFERERRALPDCLRVQTAVGAAAYRLDDKLLFNEKKNPAVPVFVIFTILAVLGDVALPLILHYSPQFKLICYIALGALNAVWLVTFIVLLVVSSKRKKARKLRLQRLADDEEEWDLAELSDVEPLKDLFVDVEEIEYARRNKNKRAVARGEDDRLLYVDTAVTFPSLVADFVKYAADCGVIVPLKKAKMLFAALGSSRLLVLRNGDKKLLETFISALSSFLGSSKFAADASKYKSPTDVFQEANGILSALNFANREKHICSFFTMNNVDMGKIRTYFTPLIASFGNNARSFKVDIRDIHGDLVSFSVPQNLWFILVEGTNSGKPGLPTFVADFGSVIELTLSVGTAGKPTVTEGGAVSYDQLAWMTEAARNDLEFDETDWKKLDRLEAYVDARVPYSISNKKWGQLERYVAIVLECRDKTEKIEDSRRDTLDCAVASCLAHGMTSVLLTKPADGSGVLVETVERLFGADYDNETERALKAYGIKGISA